MTTVRAVLDFVNVYAPFETQASFDNCGLLTGTPDMAVRGVHVALDCTQQVLDEAEELGANVLLTHHPLMFSPRKQLTETDAEGRLLCRLIRGRMALIAAHTCLDKAPGGVNDVLAQRCGLTDFSGTDYLRVGDLPAPTSGRGLACALESALDTTIRVMGNPDRVVHRLAVSSGAGSDSWEAALSAGADVFLSGEVKHHHALAAADSGMLCLEAGHFATEAPGIFALADALQNFLNALQCNVCVSKSRASAYACAHAPVDGEV